LKGSHDQRIACQNRNALAKFRVHRGFASPFSGIVKARQVIMNQRCTVQELDRGSRSRS
jgi:hypothetical protein